jgi:DNA polymerase sigma
MVLKELLALRCLNEPFPGGLSCYALMLLVVAVLKERNAIREEMERIERQRRGLTNAYNAKEKNKRIRQEE